MANVMWGTGSKYAGWLPPWDNIKDRVTFGHLHGPIHDVRGWSCCPEDTDLWSKWGNNTEHNCDTVVQLRNVTWRSTAEKQHVGNTNNRCYFKIIDNYYVVGETAIIIRHQNKDESRRHEGNEYKYTYIILREIC